MRFDSLGEGHITPKPSILGKHIGRSEVSDYGTKIIGHQYCVVGNMFGRWHSTRARAVAVRWRVAIEGESGS